MIASPSGLSNGGQDFTAWLRALPLGYTDGLAGYEASGGRWFRFVSTTLTVPAATQPASAGDFAAIWLGQNGATPRAYATIRGAAGRRGRASATPPATARAATPERSPSARSPVTAWRSASTTTARATTTSPPATSPRPPPGRPG